MDVGLMGWLAASAIIILVHLPEYSFPTRTRAEQSHLVPRRHPCDLFTRIHSVPRRCRNFEIRPWLLPVPFLVFILTFEIVSQGRGFRMQDVEHGRVHHEADPLSLVSHG